MDTYYQCKLQNGQTETVAWIASRGARVGRVVQLLPSCECWTVAEVYTHGLPENVLKETRRLNRRSLPSVEPIS